MTAFPLFPCRGKIPRTRHGFKDATTDPATLDYWAWRWPGCNWGTPIPAGMFVVDVDTKSAGYTTLAALETEHGQLPATRTAATRSGGRHIWLATTTAVVRQTISELGPGLDTRCHGKGYVIVPPSAGYRWLDTGPVAPAPEWLVAKLRPRPAAQRQQRPAAAAGNASRYAEAALLAECDQVRAIPVGAGLRNKGLHTAAVKMGTLVGAGVLDQHIAAQHLLAATSLPDHEARKTILSGLGFGAANPRHLSA